MAERKAAEDEFDPRHRIVGAVVLVTLAVIFLPMILSSQPPETSPPLAERSGTETGVVTTRVLPLTENESPASSPSARNQTEKNATVRTVTHAVPIAEPVAERSGEESPVAAPPPKTSTDGKSPKTTKPSASKTTVPKTVSSPVRGWTVQVGLFSHAENVSRLQERLKQKGYSVIVDPSTPAPGKLTRVEVGPYPDVSAAKAAQARLRDELSIEGVVRKP